MTTQIRRSHREYAHRHLAAFMKFSYEQIVALDLADSALIANIDGTFYSEQFGAGWTGLCAESNWFDARSSTAAPAKTIYQQVRDLKNEIPLEDHKLLRLKTYEEYVSVTVQTNSCWVVIRRAKVTEKTRRDFVETSLQLIKWTSTPADESGSIITWTRETVTIPDEASNFELLRFGQANTAQRLADKRWQEQNCYRSVQRVIENSTAGKA